MRLSPSTTASHTMSHGVEIVYNIIYIYLYYHGIRVYRGNNKERRTIAQTRVRVIGHNDCVQIARAVPRRRDKIL